MSLGGSINSVKPSGQNITTFRILDGLQMAIATIREKDYSPQHNMTGPNQNAKFYVIKGGARHERLIQTTSNA